MDKNLTLKELAKLLNVSISTVSKALSGSPEISLETKERVQTLAKTLNYVPNSLGRNLKFSQTKTIGVIIPDILSHFFAKALYGMELMASELGYKIIIAISNDSLNKERDSIQTLISGSVDGIIMSLSQETQAKMEIEHLKDVLDHQIPLVLFDRVLSIIPCDKISINDFTQAEQATMELIDAGCNKITYMTGIPNTSVDDQRKQGYLNAVKKFGLPKQVIKFDQKNFPHAILKDLLQQNKIDAAIAADELSAILIMKSVIQSGFIIPDDISIIGFTNGIMGENFLPSLSTVDQHEEKQGCLAMETIIARIQGKLPETPVHYKLKTSIIHRESTRNYS
ncbi:LacI family DNA-binding transcriptional regulator [Christiangramia sp.]|uniref:LacI family DNA-binding transcriptional regulator n=1 Tax=Christiangramia sp. TaxID=1931228 RepID=UPI002624E963|nr:LacI family DNA-binding transcriptional regulator [Christiangramia sp.]